ncbi:MAG: hypothetical protein CL967_03795 [Euryarchaeota archaeon]|nr:hypothetical protein [Euryarchaeota archaeon]
MSNNNTKTRSPQKLFDEFKKDASEMTKGITNLMKTLERERFDMFASLEKTKKELEKDVNDQREAIEVERNALQLEKSKWQFEKKKLQDFYKFGKKIVKINVGGTLMTTRLSTLTCAGGMLASLFSGRFEPDTDDEGNFFIDLDGTLFAEWLNLLRQVANGEKTLVPSHLQCMLKFLQPEYEMERNHYNKQEFYLKGN